MFASMKCVKRSVNVAIPYLLRNYWFQRRTAAECQNIYFSRKCYKEIQNGIHSTSITIEHGKRVHGYTFAMRAFSTSLQASVTVSSDRKTVRVVGSVPVALDSSYHAVWLRHHCSCPKCKHPKSGRPLMAPENLLEAYTINEAEVVGDKLVVTWREEADHKGVYPFSWLVRYSYGADKARSLAKDARPKPLVGPPSEFSFQAILDSDKVRLAWLLQLVEDGLTIVNRVPPIEDAVSVLGNQIYKLRGNIYGTISSILATEASAVNDDIDDQVYSTGELEYHQDMPYYESTPGIQLIHCYKRGSSVVGGESSLVDVLCLAEQFREVYPEDFEILTKVPVRLGVQFENLKFMDRPMVHFEQQRPLISVGLDNVVTAVIWDPGTELPLCVDGGLVEPYYRARKRFLHYLMAAPLKKEFILNEGSILVFNNRRLVHRRKGFQLNGGTRHMLVGFINIDEFKSEVHSLCLLCGRDPPLTRLGDNNITF